MKKILIALVPVLHQGYITFFKENPDAKELYIVGPELSAEFPYLAKDIRTMDVVLVKKVIESLEIFDKVELLDKAALARIVEEKPVVIMPNEDISKTLAEKYLPKVEILYSPIFLRWDKHSVVLEKEVNPDRKISREGFDRKMDALAGSEGERSTDIWRRIGSVLVKDKKILCTTRNKNLPGDHTSMFEGDPRNSFHKGVHLELSTFIHSEAAAIAEMAKKGIALEGADIYVTTFPCPPCAKLIASAGIKKVFYSNGYGVLDGERILKDAGVEILKVEQGTK